MQQEKIYALRLMVALTMRLLVLLQKLVQILLLPDQQSSILIIMSKLLKHSALKFFSFSFIFLFTISLESKETIVLQEYLSNIEIAKNYQERKALCLERVLQMITAWFLFGIEKKFNACG